MNYLVPQDIWLYGWNVLLTNVIITEFDCIWKSYSVLVLWLGYILVHVYVTRWKQGFRIKSPFPEITVLVLKSGVYSVYRTVQTKNPVMTCTQHFTKTSYYMPCVQISLRRTLWTGSCSIPIVVPMLLSSTTAALLTVPSECFFFVAFWATRHSRFAAMFVTVYHSI